MVLRLMKASFWQMSLFALCFGLSFAMLWHTPAQASDDPSWKGRIESMPTGTPVGQWVVRGRTFAVTAMTQLRQENGQFANGVCVEVFSMGAGTPPEATRIASLEDNKCNLDGTVTETPTPEDTPEVTATVPVTPVATVPPVGTPTPEPEDQNDDEGEMHGRVNVMPDGMVGRWVINGRGFQTTASTEFKTENGPFAVGACVKVHFHLSIPPLMVREMETAPATLCNGSVPTGTPAPHDGHHRHGVIDQLPPTGLLGTWLISGVEYLVDAHTHLEQHAGRFMRGACVEVEFVPNTTPLHAVGIEAHHLGACPTIPGVPTMTPTLPITPTVPITPSRKLEIFGVLQSFPSDLIGEWNVAGRTFIADTNTEFIQEHGVFTVGVIVKVNFFIDTDGLKYARKIKTIYGHHHHGHDDGDDNDEHEHEQEHEHGTHDGMAGHAFGVVQTMTVDLPGIWVISGISYTLTANTRFVEPHSNFQVGAKVKVEYFVDGDGNRVVRKIKTTHDNGDVSDDNHFKLFGFVTQMPPDGLVGEWIVDNVVLSTTVRTKFEEEHGELGLGAYVSVEYAVVDGENVAHEIETEVPAGAGDDTTVGVVEDNAGEETGGDLQASSAASNQWVINGKSYTVTPATDLNDMQGSLAVGETVVVNSYTAADGTQVATQILGVTLNNIVYLPNILR